MAFMTVLAVAGAGLQMVGAAQQAKAQQAQLRAQADQQRAQARIAAKQEYNSKVNAALAGMNAEAVLKQGIEVAQDRGLRTKQTVGAARAAIASNGIVLDLAGSTSQDLVDDLTAAGAMDVTRIYERSEAEQLKALIQQENYDMQAGIFKEHQGALLDAASATDKQASMISPGLAALTAGVGALTSSADLLF